MRPFAASIVTPFRLVVRRTVESIFLSDRMSSRLPAMRLRNWDLVLWLRQRLIRVVLFRVC